VRALCEESFPAFTRLAFWFVQGMELIWNWHHTYVCEELRGVFEGDERFLIVNMAPGSTKTEIFSIAFPAWGMLKSVAANRLDPGSAYSTRWLPLSYSDDLVKENTSRVRDIITSEFFQECWPMRASDDMWQKFNWKAKDEHGNTHSMYGTTPEGQPTGRRAGFMVDNAFTGAILVDDPMPPKIDGSFVKMTRSNHMTNRIVRSRRALPTIPIIMLQQRIGIGDTTDFLMGPKSPDKYRKVKIPAVLDRAYVASLPDGIRELAIGDTGFTDKPVSYWEWKEPLAELQQLQKADTYLYASQYQQDPDDALLEGMIYHNEVQALIAAGRALTSIPVEPALPVHTLWDLGMNDDMSIWLYQLHGFEIRLIAFYKNNNQTIAHYGNWLADFRDKFGIRFGKHHGPHDLAVRELGQAEPISRADQFKRDYGLPIITHERPLVKRDAIDALRPLFPRIWIDKTRCEVDCLQGFNGRVEDDTWRKDRGGWTALQKYQREYDGDREVFSNEPYHNWASHPMDALQLLRFVVTDPSKAGGQKKLQPNAGDRRGTWSRK
jgi:hypothetical protein